MKTNTSDSVFQKLNVHPVKATSRLRLVMSVKNLGDSMEHCDLLSSDCCLLQSVPHTGLSTSDTRCLVASFARLYLRTPSVEQWPVRSIMSCSSMPALYSAVAHVRFPLWLVKFPLMLPSLAMSFINVCSLFAPTDCWEYRRVSAASG